HLPGCPRCAAAVEGLLLVADAMAALLAPGPSIVRGRTADRAGRFGGAIERLVVRRRRVLSRLVRRLLARRLLRRQGQDAAADDRTSVARSRAVLAQLVELDSDSNGDGARLVAAIDPLGTPDAWQGAMAALRAFEASAPLAPPLPAPADGPDARRRWARDELDVAAAGDELV
ncbi:MAG: hypothetical protein ACF8XB_02510, partial [Planctomycetota bacterium JB042]